MGKKIVWSNTALHQLDKIHLYILEESKSIKAANKVIDILYKSVSILKAQPEIFPVDIYKYQNDDSYRAFEKFSYRI